MTTHEKAQQDSQHAEEGAKLQEAHHKHAKHIEQPTVGRTLLYTLAAKDGAQPGSVGKVRPCVVVDATDDGTFSVNVSAGSDRDFHTGQLTINLSGVTVAEKPTEGAMHWSAKT